MISEVKAVYDVTRLFDGVIDNAGMPYIEHCQIVALRAKNMAKSLNLPDYKVQEIYLAGLYHDVIEDLGYTKEDIEYMTDSKTVAEMVETLTKKPTEEYNDYLNRILEDRYCSIVKWSDAYHNSEVSRFPTMKERKKRLNRCIDYFKNSIVLFDRINRE